MNSNKIEDNASDEPLIKNRFFSQYYGVNCFQNIMNDKYGFNTYPIPFLDDRDINGQYCVLKSLSKITDEEATEIKKITGANHLIFNPLEYSCLRKHDAIEVIDYLRSQGYAIPFMNYSVEDLISKGWVKLI